MTNSDTHIWNAKSISQALGSQIDIQFNASHLYINSKEVRKDSIFLGIKGIKMDGSDFAQEAIDNGAVAAIVGKFPSSGVKEKDKHKYILVDNTDKALDKIAMYSRNRIKSHVIGITGSVGKTSTKEMLNLALTDQGKTFCSAGNFNNQYGVPYSMANIHPETKYVILEMGMRKTGEIDHLSSIVKPNIAIITKIAPSHLEFFTSVSAIAQAKAEIYNHMDSNNIAIINADDQYSTILKENASRKKLKIISFGISEKSDFRLEEYKIEETKSILQIRYWNKSLHYEIPTPGLHHAINSLAVLAAVHSVDGDVDFAAYQMSLFSPCTGRGKVHRKENMNLIDETYNANPESMAASLKVLSNYGKRKVAVLGDMKELGKNAAAFHKDLLPKIIDNKIDLVHTFGELMENLHNILPDEIRGKHFDNIPEAQQQIKKSIQENDTILFKGSNTMNMKKIIEYIMGS